MTLLRRFLVLAALAFWQGGFTFYAAVVIHVGAQALGGHRHQAAVTVRVTPYLNLAGGAALVLLAWDVAAARDASLRRRLLRGALCLGMLAALAGQLWLYPRLAAGFDDATHTVGAPERYHGEHKIYLYLSSAQWGLALAYLLLTLKVWRDGDVRSGQETGPDAGRGVGA
jgi:hypothetical protein